MACSKNGLTLSEGRTQIISDSFKHRNETICPKYQQGNSKDKLKQECVIMTIVYLFSGLVIC